MELKVASYNISGGFFRDDQSVDYLDREKANDIDLGMLDDVVRIINEENIDIICFQEIITTERIHYINKIIEKTSLEHEEHFELSPCNAVENTECGLAVLSKYPILDCVKQIFTNPRLSKTTSSGKTYYTFDKGFLMVKIKVNDILVSVLTHHGFPFGRFNSAPEKHEEVFLEFDNYIKGYNPDIIAGDFNAENFMSMMPYTRRTYVKTINEATKDDGVKLDNILLKRGVEYSSKVIRSLSDHYVVIDKIKL